MIGLLEVLTPSSILFLFALLTVPVLSLLRRLKTRCRFLSTVWMLTPFLFLGISIIHLYSQYYGQVDAEPFVKIFWVEGQLSHLSSSFLVDAVSIYMSIVYFIVGLVSCIYAVVHIGFENEFSERYFALLFMVLGSVMAATFSGDLLTLFIFWEACAAGSCFLIIYRRRPKSIEACLKYLVMIIIASGFIVYGLSMIYGLAGSLNFWTVREVLMLLPDKRLLMIAFAFVACGYAIETAVVPFHMWLPDAYTTAPSSSSAFLSAVVDQASYYVFMRVLVYILTPPFILNWPFTLAVFSALTMTIGNLFALAQDKIKRMISYVCIADIGYNLIGITSVEPLGVMGNLFFFFVGGVTTAVAFMTVGILNNLGIERLKDFSGIGKKFPATGLALVLAVFSFSGIPPLAGFMAKYMVFTAAIEAGMTWLAVIGVLNSVLQTAYLMRLVHYMYAKQSRKKIVNKPSKAALVPVYMLVALIVLLGLYPSLLLSVIYPAAQQLSLLVPS